MVKKINLIIASLYSIIFSQWTIISGPENQSISKIISDNSDIYVATQFSELYTSSNDGINWEDISTEGIELFPYGLDLFEKVDNYLFISQNIGEGPYNYRSYYNGESWEGWQELPYQSTSLLNFLSNNNIIYTVIDGNISRSIDYGLSWEIIDIPDIDGYIKLLFLDDEYLFISHGCNLYRLSISSNLWLEITGILDSVGPDEPYTCTHVSDLHKFNNDLIISMYWYGGVGTLFHSSNGGDVWNLISSFPSLSNSGNGQNSISSIASKNNILYVGTGSSEGGIFYTEDLIQWDEYNEGLDSYAISVSNLITSSNYIYKTGGVINAYQRELIQPSFLIADINLDGEIDVLDVIMIINFILLIEEPTSIEFYLSDVNSDNQIDILDIIYIINLILELN